MEVSRIAQPSVEAVDVDAAEVGAPGGAAPTARVHFPCFEGLRGLAAVMVVVHHASALAGDARSPAFFHRTTSVMDSGVAVFFVISGFLIYRPFAVAHLAVGVGLRARAFFWRRLLRLIPAYWLALSFFWAIGNFDLSHDWWRFYLFGQIYSRTTALGGLVQAWSLCTEVTFYLMIPVWAGVMRRVTTRVRATGVGSVARVELAGCALLYGSGFVARQVISARNPSWRPLSFTWLPTNIDLFAVGMALAAVSAWAAADGRIGRRVDTWARHGGLWWAGGIALFAWYAARVGPPTEQGYLGFFWQQRQFTLGLMTALLLVPVAFGPQDRGLVRRTLRSRPVTWVGMISYGLYLWHFDLMKRVVDRVNIFTGEVVWRGWANSPGGDTNVLVLLVVGLGLGALCAGASWYLLEKPVERFKRLVR